MINTKTLLGNLKTVVHKSDGDIITRGMGTRTEWTGELENKRTSRDHPKYNIVKIGQNTEKSPGDLGKP